jgi:hypothetical protein
VIVLFADGMRLILLLAGSSNNSEQLSFMQGIINSSEMVNGFLALAACSTSLYEAFSAALIVVVAVFISFC